MASRPISSQEPAVTARVEPLNSLEPLEVKHSTLIDAHLEAAVQRGMLRITLIRPLGVDTIHVANPKRSFGHFFLRCRCLTRTGVIMPEVQRTRILAL